MSFTSIYFNKKPQTYVEIGYCLFPTKKLSIHKMPFMEIQFYFSFFIVLVVIFSNLEKLGFGLPRTNSISHRPSVSHHNKRESERETAGRETDRLRGKKDRKERDFFPSSYMELFAAAEQLN